MIDTTEIKIVVVNPLNKNFKLVNPSTLFGEIIKVKKIYFSLLKL